MELGNAEKIYGLSLLWKEVQYNFANFDKVPELNWDEAYESYIPLTLNAKSTMEYYDVLCEFMALLKDGHTYVMPPKNVLEQLYCPKAQFDALKHRIIITSADELMKEEMPIGAEVIEANGIPIEKYLREEIFPYVFSSTEHYKWKMAAKRLFVDYNHNDIQIKIQTMLGEIKKIDLKRYSIMKVGFEKYYGIAEPRTEFKTFEDDIAYLALNTFMMNEVLDDFRKCLADIKKCKGLIIDLRKNQGGSSDTAHEIIKHFTDKPFHTSRWKSPKHIAAFKSWNDNYEEWYEEGSEIIATDDCETIRMPIAVLTSNHTFSAAEDFLVAMDSIKSVVTIGQRTAGSTGNAVRFKLPGGGSAAVCSKKDVFPDGREFVRYGIRPDVEVEPALNDVIGKSDSTLEKGLEIIKQKIQCE